MLAAARSAQFFHHRFVYQVRAALHRRQQPTSSRHCRPALRAFALWTESCLGQRRLDLPRAIFQPVQHRPPAEPLNFVVAMMNVPRHLFARARKNAEFRRRRPRIDGQNPATLPMSFGHLTWLHCSQPVFVFPARVGDFGSPPIAFALVLHSLKLHLSNGVSLAPSPRRP